MVIHKIGNLFFYPVILVLIAGCTGNSQTDQNPAAISITDFSGRKISLEKPAERVVCLIESALSGIYMLGMQEKVVGIPGDVYHGETWERYAEMDDRIQHKILPTPGNWDFISIEQVVALQPDLVIIWSSQNESIENLEHFGIPVYAVMLHGFEDIIKEIRDFGMLLGCEGRSEELIDLTLQNLSLVENTMPKKQKKSVYFMWAQGINETSGTKSTVGDLLEYAGVINACNLPNEHVTLSIEKLIDWDPDLIVMWYNEKMDPEDVIENPLLQRLSAIQNKKVYEFPSAFDCDLWTLKFVYPVQLVHHWAYGNDLDIEMMDFNHINDLLYGQTSQYNE